MMHYAILEEESIQFLEIRQGNLNSILTLYKIKKLSFLLEVSLWKQMEDSSVNDGQSKISIF